MTDKELWKAYREDHKIESSEYETWAFGGNPNKLAQLVWEGEKVATASAYPLYELESEPLPQVGAYSVIVDAEEKAVCIIQTTKVYIVPFNEVSEAHAYKEGEGDKSLTYWRAVHDEFFTACLSEVGLVFDEQMKVVCEEFKLVYKNEAYPHSAY